MMEDERRKEEEDYVQLQAQSSQKQTNSHFIQKPVSGGEGK